MRPAWDNRIGHGNNREVEQRYHVIDKTNDFGLDSFMSGEAINRLDVLQALLRAPLRVTGAKQQLFPAGWITPDEVIVTHRFLMILKGVMDYTVEGRTRRVEAGMQFFVPAWCRREWRVPRSCLLSWCEFSSGPVDIPALLCWRTPRTWRVEVTAFDRIRALGKAGVERALVLRQEGELKACLARFWTEARTDDGMEKRLGLSHPEVTRAVAWLERHFAEPDALEAFYRTVTLSPNHFRLLFKQQTGETVQAVLARLRLRRARYLVQETSMSMKEVAAETGHADPLYFSLQYRRFWGRPATQDRKTGGVA